MYSKIYCFKDFSIFAKYSSLYLLSYYFSAIRSWIFLFKTFYPSSDFLLILLTYLLKFSILIAFSNIYSFNFLICLSMNWLFYLRLDSTPLVLDFSSSLFVLISFISLFLVSSIDNRVLFKLFTSLIFSSSYRSKLWVKETIWFSLITIFSSRAAQSTRKLAISFNKNSISWEW